MLPLDSGNREGVGRSDKIQSLDIVVSYQADTEWSHEGRD